MMGYNYLIISHHSIIIIEYENLFKYVYNINMQKPWLAKLLLNPEFIPNCYDIVIYNNVFALVTSNPIEVNISTYDATSLMMSNHPTRPITCNILVDENEFNVDVSTLTNIETKIL